MPSQFARERELRFFLNGTEAAARRDRRNRIFDLEAFLVEEPEPLQSYDWVWCLMTDLPIPYFGA